MPVQGGAGSPAGSAPGPGESAVPPGKPGFELPFDPLRLAAALVRRWWLMVLCGGALAAGGAVLGKKLFHTLYTANAQLMRQESSGSFRASDLGEPFKPRQLSVSTLVSFIKSPAVLQGVSDRSKPHVPVSAIAGNLTITPERNTDLITVSYKSQESKAAAMAVLNLFGAEVVRLTRELQGTEAADVNRLLRHQIAKSEEELHHLNDELLAFSKETGVVSVDKEVDAYLGKISNLELRFETTRIDYETMGMRIQALEKELAAHNPLVEQVAAARDRLAQARAEMTDSNPTVVELKEKLADAEKELKNAPPQAVTAPRGGPDSALAITFYQELISLKTQKEVLASQLEKLKEVRAGAEEKLRGLPEKGLQFARIKARQQSLEAAASLLTSRQREAQVYEDNPPGYYRFFEAKADQVEVAGPTKKLIIVIVAGLVLGCGAAAALVCLVESFDNRVRTPADARRVTKLPLIARLPDLKKLDASARATWAFRTWMSLQTPLGPGPGGLVCGWVSSTEGEGVSTWIELLAGAASLRDAAVLAITNRPPEGAAALPLEELLGAPPDLAGRRGTITWATFGSGWRWDTARRARWQHACRQWQRTPGAVVMIELKSADQPEPLLVAETLPQLIWVAGAGVARAPSAARRAQILRDARCRFAGVVLNGGRPLFPWSKTE